MKLWMTDRTLKIIGAAAFVVSTFLFAVMMLGAAQAADKGGPAPSAIDIPKALTSTSCMVGVYGSFVNGDLDVGGPVNIGSNGNVVGASGECGLALGSFYLGAGADYGRVFGNLKTIGVDGEMSLFGKAGVMPSANTMLYALVARSRLDTTIGDIDGWQWGGGVITKLPSAPLYVDLQVRHGSYEVEKYFGPGVDANTTSGRLGLTYRFGQ